MKDYNSDSTVVLDRFARDKRKRTTTAERIERRPGPRRDADDTPREHAPRRASYNPGLLYTSSRSGLTIRAAVSQIRVAGRATQGVRIINLREGDAIASVMAVPGSEEEELAAVEGGENPAPAATDETPAAEQ